jgi:hypothetical protein
MIEKFMWDQETVHSSVLMQTVDHLFGALVFKMAKYLTLQI